MNKSSSSLGTEKNKLLFPLRMSPQKQLTRTAMFLDDVSVPCLIKEILFAPLCLNPDITKLIEVALTYHNTCQYQLALRTFVSAQRFWMNEEYEKHKRTLDEHYKNERSKLGSDLIVDSSLELNHAFNNSVSETGEQRAHETNKSTLDFSVEEAQHSKLVRDPLQVEYERELDDLKRQSELGEFMPRKVLLYFRLVIGSVYESSGNDEMALSEFMEAKRIADEILSAHNIDNDNPDTPRSSNGSRPNSRISPSTPVSVSLIPFRSERAGSEINMRCDTSTPYSFIGSGFLHVKQYALSYRYMMKCKEMRRAMMPADHVDIAVIENNIGVSLFFLNRVEEALEQFKQAASILDSQLGTHHPRSVIAKKNLSIAKKKIASRLQ